MAYLLNRYINRPLYINYIGLGIVPSWIDSVAYWPDVSSPGRGWRRLLWSCESKAPTDYTKTQHMPPKKG